MTATRVMTRNPVSFDDCPDCHGTGRGLGERDCYLCHGTGQVRDDEDDVVEAILSAPDDAILAGEYDGLAEGTHYLDRYGNVQPKQQRPQRTVNK